MSGYFYNFGRRLGRRAVPTLRKSKWIWKGLTGNEEDLRRAEQSLGTALAVEVRAATKPADDPEAASQAGQLCEQLERHLRHRRHPFHCEVIRTESPNAMALPGGYLFVSHSLVELCERHADELAFVVGHEMAHVVRGHAWDRMLNQTALQAASAATAPAGALGVWLRRKGLQLLLSAHSREGEFEADQLGLRLSLAAGFDGEAAITLLHRIGHLGPNSATLGQYFASHPPAAERIAALRPLLKNRPSPQE